MTNTGRLLNQDLESLVTEANSLIDQIAALNEKISQVKAVGGNPNDLLDRRDLLAERLSELIGYICIYDHTGRRRGL